MVSRKVTKNQYDKITDTWDHDFRDVLDNFDKYREEFVEFAISRPDLKAQTVLLMSAHDAMLDISVMTNMAVWKKHELQDMVLVNIWVLGQFEKHPTGL